MILLFCVAVSVIGFVVLDSIILGSIYGITAIAIFGLMVSAWRRR
jgi:hypothetical protein